MEAVKNMRLPQLREKLDLKGIEYNFRDGNRNDIKIEDEKHFVASKILTDSDN